MFDEEKATKEIRELLNNMTLAAGLGEGESAAISAEVLQNLASEYELVAEELASE